jgi:hypothetical protein
LGPTESTFRGFLGSFRVTLLDLSFRADPIAAKPISNYLIVFLSRFAACR